MKSEKFLIAINALSAILILWICWPFISQGNIAAIMFFLLIATGLIINSYSLYRRYRAKEKSENK
ncbi:hypothetical protein D3H64_02985 [Atopobacter sp. AH10]|uniref:hypothetical protein n=1 Tax=Atopobacter sp. AH10 TaxID=2315861 RepID=UPI000EF21225|nr:hypothetical protein [Atopobacter sp. AH10]RLK63728.1 hypothetical protein D3H64_02985 [Atopobacter sp. AH10]